MSVKKQVGYLNIYEKESVERKWWHSYVYETRRQADIDSSAASQEQGKRIACIRISWVAGAVRKEGQ